MCKTQVSIVVVLEKSSLSNIDNKLTIFCKYITQCGFSYSKTINILIETFQLFFGQHMFLEVTYENMDWFQSTSVYLNVVGKTSVQM